MAYHTYEFLRRRKNEPKWREAYLQALYWRIVSAIFGLLVLLGILLGILLVDRYNIDVMHYVNEALNYIKNLVDKYK